MRGALINLLTLNVQSAHPAVYLGILAVWIVLLFSAIMSLRSLEISTFAKLVWMFFIVFAPILGLGTYAIFCLTKGDWSFLKLLLSKPKVAANKSVR